MLLLCCFVSETNTLRTVCCHNKGATTMDSCFRIKGFANQGYVFCTIHCSFTLSAFNHLPLPMHGHCCLLSAFKHNCHFLGFAHKQESLEFVFHSDIKFVGEIEKSCLLFFLLFMCMIFSAGPMILQAFYLIVWVISVSWGLTIDWFWKNNVRHTNEEACLSWKILQWTTHESWWWIFATGWFFISEFFLKEQEKFVILGDFNASFRN